MRKEDRTDDLGKGHADTSCRKRKIRREYSVTSRKKRGREEEHAVNRKERSEKIVKERIEKERESMQ